MPEKDKGGKIVTNKTIQEGPIAYVETTTIRLIFEEDLNRSLMVHTDERAEQTRLIMEREASQHSSNSSIIDRNAIINKHNALQRQLALVAASSEVLIPYLEELTRHLPSDRVEIRRALPLLVSAICASALLHHRQRDRDGNDRILANLDDYKLVYKYFLAPFREAMGDALADSEVRCFNLLKDNLSTHSFFTTTDVSKLLKKGKSTVTGWLAKLRDAGLVEQVEHSKGPRPAVWKFSGLSISDATSVLPAPELLDAINAEAPQPESQVTDIQTDMLPSAVLDATEHSNTQHIEASSIHEPSESVTGDLSP